MNDIIIHPCLQRSEEWEALRFGRATASQFSRILTPAKLQLSESAKQYAIELALQRKHVDAGPPQMPSYWMDHGTESEPYAIEEFERSTGLTVHKVGFITPADGSMYGCSPDGLVGEDAVIEVKCPMPSTMVGYMAANELPSEYRLQVQGELWITGRNGVIFMCGIQRSSRCILWSDVMTPYTRHWTLQFPNSLRWWTSGKHGLSRVRRTYNASAKKAM